MRRYLNETIVIIYIKVLAIELLIQQQTKINKNLMNTANDVRTSEKRKNQLLNWITSIESSINRIKRLISHVLVVIKCKREPTFTKHQKTLFHTLKKKFGNSKMSTLETKLSSLRQELKSKADNHRHQKHNLLGAKR